MTAWLNKRTFSYDCLMEHADAEELRALEAREGGTFFWLGAIGAALAYVPLLNLFAPALTGLLFVHAGLEALRRLRLERGAWIVEMDLPKGKR
ncbi:EI24 domain-containing protein [Tepidiphilus succinatimandens]|uniref:EI24 domain-containing protein n=1 Tax=Tepidiphilus succinatimandens TaxID=224436 RepID=UPI00112F5393